MFVSLTPDGLAIGSLHIADAAGPASAGTRSLEISAAVGPQARFAAPLPRRKGLVVAGLDLRRSQQLDRIYRPRRAPDRLEMRDMSPPIRASNTPCPQPSPPGCAYGECGIRS
jgi:hypothetical protein